MTKLNNEHSKLFGINAQTGLGQFGSWATGNPNQTTDIQTIQGLQAWERGWENAVVGGTKNAPPLQEMSAVQYVITQAIAYLKQQGGVTVEWNTDTTYYIGSIVGKVATSSLLGSDASKVTLVYRSVQNNNQGNALPADFISNEHWAWVDAIQPQGLNLLTLNIPVGSFMYLSADGLHPHEVPVNWAIADGRTVTLPDGTPYTTTDAKDRFILASNTDVGSTGGSSTHTTSSYGSGRRTLSAYGTLSYGNLPSWSIYPHGQYGNGYVDRADISDSSPYATPHGYTDGSNGNSQHRGGTSAQFSVTGMLDGSEYHSHTLNGLPPYLKLNIIERIF